MSWMPPGPCGHRAVPGAQLQAAQGHPLRQAPANRPPLLGPEPLDLGSPALPGPSGPWDLGLGNQCSTQGGPLFGVRRSQVSQRCLW